MNAATVALLLLFLVNNSNAAIIKEEEFPAFFQIDDRCVEYIPIQDVKMYDFLLMGPSIFQIKGIERNNTSFILKGSSIIYPYYETDLNLTSNSIVKQLDIYMQSYRVTNITEEGLIQVLYIEPKTYKIQQKHKELSKKIRKIWAQHRDENVYIGVGIVCQKQEILNIENME